MSAVEIALGVGIATQVFKVLDVLILPEQQDAITSRVTRWEARLRLANPLAWAANAATAARMTRLFTGLALLFVLALPIVGIVLKAGLWPTLGATLVDGLVIVFLVLSYGPPLVSWLFRVTTWRHFWPRLLLLFVATIVAGGVCVGIATILDRAEQSDSVVVLVLALAGYLALLPIVFGYALVTLLYFAGFLVLIFRAFSVIAWLVSHGARWLLTRLARYNKGAVAAITALATGLLALWEVFHKS